MPALGIDFGTSNSAVAVALDDGSVDVVPLERHDRPELLPTLIYLDRDELRLAGRDAARNFMVRGAATTACSRCDRVSFENGHAWTDCRQHTSGGRCADARLLAGLKYELAEPGFPGTNSWAIDFPIVELVAGVLRRLVDAARKHTGISSFDAVSIGSPFAFHGAEGRDFAARQATAKRRLVEAAELAGLQNVDLTYEAQAAASMEDAEHGLVLTADFGGGTFDVAIIDFRGEPEVVALDGAAVGGDLIDRALMRAYIAPKMGLEQTYQVQSGARLGLPNGMRSKLLDLSGIKHLMQDRDVAVLLRHFEAAGAPLPAVHELIYGGQAWEFYSQVERAKVALSDGAAEAAVDLRRLGIHEQVVLSAEDLAAVVSPLLEGVKRSISDALDSAGLSVAEIDYAVRTGGSSQLPAFVEMMNDLFGAKKVRQRDPFTTVVKGLALDALGR